MTTEVELHKNNRNYLKIHNSNLIFRKYTKLIVEWQLKPSQDGGENSLVSPNRARNEPGIRLVYELCKAKLTFSPVAFAAGISKRKRTLAAKQEEEKENLLNIAKRGESIK